MKYAYTLLFCMSVCFYSSCECWADYPLYVKDKETNEPIKDARVKCSRDCDGYTDNIGFYRAGYANEGGVGGCPDLSITISKEGYKTYFVDKAVIDKDTTTIYLERE